MDDPFSKIDIPECLPEVEDSPDRMAVNSLLSIDDVHEFNMPSTMEPTNKEPQTPKDWHQRSLPVRKPPQTLLSELPNSITVPQVSPPQLPQIRQQVPIQHQQVPTIVKMNQSLTHVKPKVRPKIAAVPELPLSTPAFLLHDSNSQPSTSTSRPKPLRKLTDPRYLNIKRTHALAQKVAGQSLAKVVFDGGQLVPPPAPIERPRALPLLPPHLAELAKSLFDKSETIMDLRQTGNLERSAEPFIRKPSADASEPEKTFRKVSRDAPVDRLSKGTGPLKILSSIHLSNYPIPQPTFGSETANKRTQPAAFFGQSTIDSYDARKRLPSLPHEASFTSNSGVKLTKTEPNTGIDPSDLQTSSGNESRQPRYIGIKGTLKVQDSPLLGLSDWIKNLPPVGMAQGIGFTNSSGIDTFLSSRDKTSRDEILSNGFRRARPLNQKQKVKRNDTREEIWARSDRANRDEYDFEILGKKESSTYVSEKKVQSQTKRQLRKQGTESERESMPQLHTVVMPLRKPDFPIGRGYLTEAQPSSQTKRDIRAFYLNL